MNLLRYARFSTHCPYPEQRNSHTPRAPLAADGKSHAKAEWWGVPFTAQKIARGLIYNNISSAPLANNTTKYSKVKIFCSYKNNCLLRRDNNSNSQAWGKFVFTLAISNKYRILLKFLIVFQVGLPRYRIYIFLYNSSSK